MQNMSGARWRRAAATSRLYTPGQPQSENYFTVWHNVFERGGLKRGETCSSMAVRRHRYDGDPTGVAFGAHVVYRRQ
jgi:hypothetical protein